MITEKDLQEAIAECEGQRNPNANTCIKLAAFYTIRDHMFGESSKMPQNEFYSRDGYSYGAEPENAPQPVVEAHSGSAFSEAVDGMPFDEFLGIMDELMSTLEIVQPRLYAGVMRKIKGLA